MRPVGVAGASGGIASAVLSLLREASRAQVVHEATCPLVPDPPVLPPSEFEILPYFLIDTKSLLLGILQLRAFFRVQAVRREPYRVIG